MCFCWTPICFNVEHLKYPLKPPFLFCPFQKRSSYFYFYVTKCTLQFFSLCPLNFTERERIGRWPMPFNAKCVWERERVCVWVRVWVCVRVFEFPTEGKWEWKRADDLFNSWARQGCGHIFQAHTLSLSLSFSFLHTHTLSPTHTFHEWALSLSFSLSLSLYFSLFLFEAEIRVGVF